MNYLNMIVKSFLTILLAGFFVLVSFDKGMADIDSGVTITTPILYSLPDGLSGTTENLICEYFLGSGTTSLAAAVSNRNSIGYEINKDFIPNIEDKLNSQKDTLFGEFEFNFVYQNLHLLDWKNEIKKLKYVFEDPVNFDKKINPNKLKFGSKINIDDGKNGVKREKYYIFTISIARSCCGTKVVPVTILSSLLFAIS